MRKAVACLAVLLLGTASPVSAGDYTYDRDAVVRITCEPRGAVGTAFHLGDGLYATATHVVEGCEGKFNYTSEGDFALFRGPVIAAKLRYSCSPYRAGDEYIATGYAGGDVKAWAIPWLASKVSIKRGYTAFYGDGIPGMSGGPVIDSNGAARGVVNQRWPAHSIAFKDTELCRK